MVYTGFRREKSSLCERGVSVFNKNVYKYRECYRECNREPWGGASPHKFEKRPLTIFRLEPDPYKSVHQLNCSLLFPTAMVNGIESTRPILVIKSNKQQTSAAIDHQHSF